MKFKSYVMINNRLIYIVFFALGGLLMACTQDVPKKLVSISNPAEIGLLQKDFFKARLSPDGKTTLLTDQKESGLFLFNFDKNEVLTLNADMALGTEVLFSPDGSKVYYLTHDYSTKKRSSSLLAQDVQNGEKTVLLQGFRKLKLIGGDGSKLLLLQNGEIREFNTADGSIIRVNKEHKAVFLDDKLNLRVLTQGESKVLNPLGEAQYLWPSLSPDGKKILFSVSGKGSFTYTLQGEELVELGRLHAPKWSADGAFIIAMDDKDDGQKFTASDIYLLSANGKERQNLTVNTDKIALYPELAPDLSKVIFNDENGKVYEMKIN